MSRATGAFKAECWTPSTVGASEVTEVMVTYSLKIGVISFPSSGPQNAWQLPAFKPVSEHTLGLPDFEPELPILFSVWRLPIYERRRNRSVGLDFLIGSFFPDVPVCKLSRLEFVARLLDSGSPVHGAAAAPRGAALGFQSTYQVLLWSLPRQGSYMFVQFCNILSLVTGFSSFVKQRRSAKNKTTKKKCPLLG